jgi:hypothetical protein
MNIKEIHTYYYNLAVKSGNPPCGEGSKKENVVQAGTIDFIKDIISRYNIKSIADCPCGLYENWFYLIDAPSIGVKYMGFDINDDAILRNQESYPELEFSSFNMVTQILPAVDLIICRDCLFHMPNSFVIETLKNFKSSGSLYLLSTTQTWLEANYELNSEELKNEAGNKPINLSIAPFSLGSPIELHDENVPGCFHCSRIRSLGLWKLR